METDGEGDVVFSCCDGRRGVLISLLMAFGEGEVRRIDMYKQKLKVGVMSARDGLGKCPARRSD